MSFRFNKAKVLLSAALITMSIQVAQAAKTIKVGALHSLSGTMDSSEATLKDNVLMMIDK